MTDKQAMSKARSLWGKAAAIEKLPKSEKFPERLTHRVGQIVMANIFPMFSIHGQGRSWEEAFKRAEEETVAARALGTQK